MINRALKIKSVAIVPKGHTLLLYVKAALQTARASRNQKLRTFKQSESVETL